MSTIGVNFPPFLRIIPQELRTTWFSLVFATLKIMLIWSQNDQCAAPAGPVILVCGHNQQFLFACFLRFFHALLFWPSASRVAYRFWNCAFLCSGACLLPPSIIQNLFFLSFAFTRGKHRLSCEKLFRVKNTAKLGIYRNLILTSSFVVVFRAIPHKSHEYLILGLYFWVFVAKSFSCVIIRKIKQLTCNVVYTNINLNQLIRFSKLSTDGVCSGSNFSVECELLMDSLDANKL